MKDIFLISACRTPIGSFGGSLKDVPAADLGAAVIEEALRRADVAPEQAGEVYMGCVLTAGLGQNVARQASVKAGIPVSTTATTLNMVCGSGLKAIVDGARSILAGDNEIVVAGGIESMSRAPYLAPSARWGARMSDAELVDSMVRDGLWDIFNNYHMGITAENVAQQWGITREELDAFSLASQQKTAAAIASGKFRDEIAPISVRVKKDVLEFAADEYPRATDAGALAKLKPAFKKEGGVVTAGNASGINDGAACVILASSRAVRKNNLKPMAKILSWGQAGVDPSIMGMGPVGACRKALFKANLTVDDLDLIEANEAFAAQSIAVARELGFDMEKVNVNGGAIALGHPIGCSGTRIAVTLLHELKRRAGARLGLATLCIGGGMGIAAVFEKC